MRALAGSRVSRRRNRKSSANQLGPDQERRPRKTRRQGDDDPAGERPVAVFRRSCLISWGQRSRIQAGRGAPEPRRVEKAARFGRRLRPVNHRWHHPPWATGDTVGREKQRWQNRHRAAPALSITAAFVPLGPHPALPPSDGGGRCVGGQAVRPAAESAPAWAPTRWPSSARSDSAVDRRTGRAGRARACGGSPTTHLGPTGVSAAISSHPSQVPWRTVTAERFSQRVPKECVPGVGLAATPNPATPCYFPRCPVVRRPAVARGYSESGSPGPGGHSVAVP